MLPANLINALQALSRSDKPLIQAATDAPKNQPKLQVGQEVQGTIQSKVNEGMFKVQVAGQSLQMKLPGSVQPGDAIRLQVASLNPRLTFNIITSQNPISTPDKIGSAARLIANLAEQPLERPVVRHAERGAVWAAADQPPPPKQLAGALREALASSGLFYESHQAQWVRGERSTTQLLIEPQNRLTGKQEPLAYASPAHDSAAPPQRTDNIAAPRLTPQGALIEDAVINQTRDIAAQANSGNTVAAHKPSEPGLPVPRDLVPLVQQQLHTLETHHLAWIGQVWPGQEMQWEIQGQPEHSKRTASDEERQWSTEMELALPHLGDVHARLILTHDGLKMQLRAADSSTAALFTRKLPELSDAMEGAGITISSAQVNQT
jgi:flagellar hook-length control protein FliK